MLQKTLVVLKPDAVKRNIVGEVITRFERVGLHLVGMKMLWPNEEFYYKHYEEIGTMITRYNQEIFNVNRDFMMSGPVVAMVWEGPEAIEIVRKLVGSTQPKAALPGTIRGDFAHVGYDYVDQNNGWMVNIVHASANAEEAEKELALWFAGTEIFDHEVAGHLHKRGHHTKK